MKLATPTAPPRCLQPLAALRRFHAAVGRVRRQATDLTGRDDIDTLVSVLGELAGWEPAYRIRRVKVTWQGDEWTVNQWQPAAASLRKLAALEQRVRRAFAAVAGRLGDDSLAAVIERAVAAATDVLPADRARRVRRWLGSLKAGG